MGQQQEQEQQQQPSDGEGHEVEIHSLRIKPLKHLCTLLTAKKFPNVDLIYSAPPPLNRQIMPVNSLTTADMNTLLSEGYMAGAML
jgi:hypothetical protein